jgi:hypothetical protein
MVNVLKCWRRPLGRVERRSPGLRPILIGVLVTVGCAQAIVPRGEAQTATLPDARGVGMSRETAQVATTPRIVADVRLSDPPSLSDTFELGGLSGLFALDADGKTFVSLTDRGPNGEIKVRGEKQMLFPLPTYSPRIVKLRVEAAQLKVVETIPIRLPEGYTDLVTSTREVSGLPGADGNGEVPYDGNGKERLPMDPHGMDTEGIAVDPRDGTFWLAEEYGPSILHVGTDGTVLARMVPAGLELDAPGEDVRPLLPAALTGRKPNRGFEGIAITPDGSRVFAMMQSPLSNPNEKTGEISRNVRLLVLDTSNATIPKLAGTYVYRTESASDVGAKEQDDVKIGDIAAVSGHRILVNERDSSEGGSHKKVYAFDIANASDVTERDDFHGKTLEQAGEADLERLKVQAGRKSLVVDLAKLGYRPEKLEGLAIVDAHTIAVVNDNDFGIEAIDDKKGVVKNGAPSRLVIIRLAEALQ